jgi:small GTP-binding protein
MTDGMPPATAELRITIQMKRDRLSESEERWLHFALAAFLEISPSCVSIVRQEPANSVRVSISLPEEAARTLLQAFRESDPRLAEFLGSMTISQIDEVANGRVDIVVFGGIAAGKSSLINALVDQDVAKVSIRGGTTVGADPYSWEGSGYSVPSFKNSRVYIIDTPGFNEIDGEERARIAQVAAERADLVLFVTDKDLDNDEFNALVELRHLHKPLLVVLNKVDRIKKDDLMRLLDFWSNERLRGIVDRADIVTASADPADREVEIHHPDGRVETVWRKPPADVTGLKVRILEVLAHEGKALVALNAAMFAADRSDKLVSIRVRLRDQAADNMIWENAVHKAVAVGLNPNPIPIVDMDGGVFVDAGMAIHLGALYGIDLNKRQAADLIRTILQSASWMTHIEVVTGVAAGAFSALTFGISTVATALPQGAVAGYGSYIVGKAAESYFERGGSWGEGGPKAVVGKILESVDKGSIIAKLKDEIRDRLVRDRYAADR